jgi:hypothetical protein
MGNARSGGMKTSLIPAVSPPRRNRTRARRGAPSEIYAYFTAPTEQGRPWDTGRPDDKQRLPTRLEQRPSSGRFEPPRPGYQQDARTRASHRTRSHERPGVHNRTRNRIFAARERTFSFGTSLANSAQPTFQSWPGRARIPSEGVLRRQAINATRQRIDGQREAPRAFSPGSHLCPAHAVPGRQ